MPDEPNNIVLEHLRHIRRAVDRIELDLTDVKIQYLLLNRCKDRFWLLWVQ